MCVCVFNLKPYFCKKIKTMVAIRGVINKLDKIYTVEEYFEFEKNSEVRHEFYYGKLIEMPGEAKKANRIAMNIYRKWIDSMEQQGFEIFPDLLKCI